jgi:CheY-like chemotaxis protein
MKEEDTNQKPFLLVDDDPDFLAVASTQLKELSGGRWVIRTATNHAQALEQLKAQQVRVIVLDLEMPVMDGIEFLRLLGRTHPGQQVVMLSERMDQGTRKASLDLGASLFLEKPTSPEGFRALFSALDALAGAAPQSGFRGLMQSMSLEDLLQMECLARKSSILVVSTGNRRGQIYIRDGEIVHAVSGQLEGEMALYGLLALTGGDFNLRPYAEPPHRSISGQYQFLLMEAARLRDEAGPQPGAESDAGRPGFDFEGASGDTPTPTQARGVRIEEVLLCSNTGEVVYQWQCESVENRLELLKQLEHEVMEASKDTPCGRFRRVSMDTGKSRVLVQIQPTFKLLVRSALPAPTTNE